MRIRMFVFPFGCMWVSTAGVCLCGFSRAERARKEKEKQRGVLQHSQPAPGSPFNPQMTYLDSFMFAWRRIKKALHFPFTGWVRMSAQPSLKAL